VTRNHPSLSRHQLIYLHADAPAKPEVGAACNGCGLCCMAEPCPAGVLVTGRRKGACRALRWSNADGRYLCGLVSDPSRVLRWLPRRLAPLASRLARRWIALATGCDANLVAERAGG
jgi:hypothetical protein